MVTSVSDSGHALADHSLRSSWQASALACALLACDTIALSAPLGFSVKLEDDTGASVTIDACYATAIAVPYAATVGGQNTTSAKMETLRIPLDRFRVGAPPT